MHQKFVVVLLALLSLSANASFDPYQVPENYQVYINLNQLQNDQLQVEIVPPIGDKDTVEFHMPRIVPGTYDVHDYGRFVSEFKVVDFKGEALAVSRLDSNRWAIYNAKKIYKISYKVDDTFDFSRPTGIFEPAGTGFDSDVFVLNNFGVIGYINTLRDKPFHLEISKPKGFYASTALPVIAGDTSDFFTASNYFELHDSPIMYCEPDTATHHVGGAEILVSVYSPSKKVNAKNCMDRIAAVLNAASTHLGGTLPVEKYAVLIYCVPLDLVGSSYGALEHHTSTVLYMPEFDGDEFYDGVRDITSHEFFHIVTPLNIHSEMIANFDFINPEMSEHLWLYEGITEYNSHLVQIRDGIYPLSKYLEVLTENMHSNDGFNQNVPLTQASKYTLSFYKDEYHNFYKKGALSGLALDLKLLNLSNGSYGLVDLLTELGESYGVDTFFVDADLFDIITEKTYPEMREFFARHYEGAEPFPLKELFETVGIQYDPIFESQEVSFGDAALGYNFETSRIRIESLGEDDSFGEELGWKEGDEIVEFNGEPIDLMTINEVITNYVNTTNVGDKVVVRVARPKGDGFKEIDLKAKARMVTFSDSHRLVPMSNVSDAQLKLRKSWINQ